MTRDKVIYRIQCVANKHSAPCINKSANAYWIYMYTEFMIKCSIIKRFLYAYVDHGGIVRVVHRVPPSGGVGERQRDI